MIDWPDNAVCSQNPYFGKYTGEISRLKEFGGYWAIFIFIFSKHLNMFELVDERVEGKVVYIVT